MDVLLPRSPLWRKAIWKLPDRLHAQPKLSCAVRVLSPDGGIVHEFGGTYTGFANPTAVCQVGEKAWMAGLFYKALASFDLPDNSGPGPVAIGDPMVNPEVGRPNRVADDGQLYQAGRLINQHGVVRVSPLDRG